MLGFLPMPPLLWLAAGLVGGYFAGRRSVRWQITTSLRREASALLDSVGRLGQSGALHTVEGLKLSHGSPRDGVQLLIKTRDAAPFDWESYLEG